MSVLTSESPSYVPLPEVLPALPASVDDSESRLGSPPYDLGKNSGEIPSPVSIMQISTCESTPSNSSELSTIAAKRRVTNLSVDAQPQSARPLTRKLEENSTGKPSPRQSRMLRAYAARTKTRRNRFVFACAGHPKESHQDRQLSFHGPHDLQNALPLHPGSLPQLLSPRGL